MKALIVVLMISACGSKPAPDCPTVEALGGNDPAAQRELAIVVARCKADDWSKDVTDCLARAATDEMAQEKCFHALTPAQQAKLKKAFEPIESELVAADKAGVLAGLDRSIAAPMLDELVARAPGCAEIKAALQAARDQLAKCEDPDALQAFGLSELARKKSEQLRAMTDPQQVGAACTELAKDLTLYGDGCH